MTAPLLPWRIVLASASPRRHQLVQALGLEVEVVRAEVDETPPAGMDPALVAEHIARRKADAWAGTLAPDQVLVTADTTVVIGQELLNKPADPADARRMLALLCGREHAVHTGVCLRTARERLSFTDTARVRMAPLTADEIAWYVAHHRPLDKAGAYGVQDWIGMAGVEGITGSFYTVMGLPTHRLYRALRELAH
ncbi:MAG: Maf family protein [Flavobacteriales bacterium]|jgi:septum formation protein|nr:Maf family protein [Flavobacteriales bacterium]